MLMDSADQIETRLVWDFFDKKTSGIFVEVGANHPKDANQTWFLEQQGWSGLLVEPNPELFKLLCEQRPRSRAVQAAVGSQSGEVELLLGVDHQHSTLVPTLGDPMSGKKVKVPLRTLDSILREAGVTVIDFLSIDVEGMELQVLQGLNLEKYAPRLILMEEHRRDYSKHNHLRQHGYRLVRRTGRNNWYVPPDSPVTVRTLNTPGEAFRMWRKMWLNPPFDKLKRRITGGFQKNK
jgi:FkbM family methyltransferase